MSPLPPSRPHPSDSKTVERTGHHSNLGSLDDYRHRPETIRLPLQSQNSRLPQPVGPSLMGSIQAGRLGKGLASLCWNRKGEAGRAGEGSWGNPERKLLLFVGGVHQFRYNVTAKI